MLLTADRRTLGNELDRRLRGGFGRRPQVRPVPVGVGHRKVAIRGDQELVRHPATRTRVVRDLPPGVLATTDDGAFAQRANCLRGSVGLGPQIGALPISVGDAVLFVAYLQLFGAALDNIKGMAFSYKSIYRIATPVLFGLALMTVPPTAFNSIPAIMRTLLQNGLVMGILVAMILEHTIRWDKQK